MPSLTPVRASAELRDGQITSLNPCLLLYLSPEFCTPPQQQLLYLQNIPQLPCLSLLTAHTPVQATISSHLDHCGRGTWYSIMNQITMSPTQDPPKNFLPTWSKSELFSMACEPNCWDSIPEPPVSPNTTLSCLQGQAPLPPFCTHLCPSSALRL